MVAPMNFPPPRYRSSPIFQPEFSWNNANDSRRIEPLGNCRNRGVAPVSSWDKPVSAFRAFYRLFLIEPSLFVFTGGRELVQMVEIGIVNGRQLQLVSQFEKSQIIFR